MKVLQILVLILTGIISVNAQIDCAVSNKFVVRDYDRNVVKNAKLEIYTVDKAFNKTFAFSPQKVENDVYYFISTLGSFRAADDKFFSVSGSYRLRVTAEGFNIYEQSVKFERCKALEQTVVLEKINQEIKLTGVVFDPTGAIVVGAKLTARNKSGEIFHAQTDEDGNYLFRLLPGIYEIELEYRGFKKQTVKGFLLVNSTYGKISRDFALELENSSECEPAGCFPDSQAIELPKSQVSDTVLSRPLEEVPKVQNKSKRKRKIINNEQFNIRNHQAGRGARRTTRGNHSANSGRWF